MENRSNYTRNKKIHFALAITIYVGAELLSYCYQASRFSTLMHLTRWSVRAHRGGPALFRFFASAVVFTLRFGWAFRITSKHAKAEWVDSVSVLKTLQYFLTYMNNNKKTVTSTIHLPSSLQIALRSIIFCMSLRDNSMGSLSTTTLSPAIVSKSLRKISLPLGSYS